MIKDNQEEIDSIQWTVSGKVRKVIRTAASSKPNLEFEYDASGQRIVKKVIRKNGEITSTYYLRDASGNVMSVYAYNTNTDNAPVLSEQYLYGSSRIGVYTPSAGVLSNTRVFGRKSYELSDHLGNVRATLSDYRRLASQAIVNSASDYYPFGMAIVGRQVISNNGYRYGFNGQEHESDWNDNYTFEYRIHDPRLGRFLSIDPLLKKYPYNSPYAFCQNRPIDGIDLEGREWSSHTTTNYADGWTNIKYTVKIKVPTDDQLFTVEEYKKYLGQITADAEQAYNKVDKDSKTRYEMDIVYEYVPSANISSSDFSVKLQDVTPDNKGEIELGHVTTIGNTQSNTIYLTAKVNGAAVQPGGRNFAHELGHTGGLEHPYHSTDMATAAMYKQMPDEFKTTLMMQNSACGTQCNNDLTASEMGVLNMNIKTKTSSEIPAMPTTTGNYIPVGYTPASSTAGGGREQSGPAKMVPEIIMQKQNVPMTGAEKPVKKITQ